MIIEELPPDESTSVFLRLTCTNNPVSRNPRKSLALHSRGGDDDHEDHQEGPHTPSYTHFHIPHNAHKVDCEIPVSFINIVLFNVRHDQATI